MPVISQQNLHQIAKFFQSSLQNRAVKCYFRQLSTGRAPRMLLLRIMDDSRIDDGLFEGLATLRKPRASNSQTGGANQFGTSHI